MSEKTFLMPRGATIVTCLRVVADLARQGVLEDDDPDMAGEVERQVAAVGRIDALIASHADDLLSLEKGRGGIGAAPILDAKGFTRDIDLGHLRATSAAPHRDSMLVVLELACQQVTEEGNLALVDGIRIRVGDAIDIAGSFYEMEHERIRSLGIDLSIPETDTGEDPRP